MYRYVALAWNATDPREIAIAGRIALRFSSALRDWMRVIDTPGLLVCQTSARDNRAYVLGETGAVLGRVFRQREDERPSPAEFEFDEPETLAIRRTRGRHLVDHYWGRYVAFVYDRHAATHYVLRDPTGGLSCFVTTYQGVDVYFSDVEDCIALGLGQFSVDWGYIAAFVGYPGLQIRDTGLIGVSEVQPGECVQFNGASRTRTLYWDPVRIAESKPLEDEREAISALRHAARTCIRAWASGHERVMLRLSGGLDSSIVASCLSSTSSRPALTALNYYTDDAEGDERAFARLVANRVGCKLIEKRRIALVRLDAVLNIVRFAKPWHCAHFIEYSRTEAQIAHDLGATAVFTGGGGDSLFYQAQASLSAADCARRYGLRSRLFRVAMDVARLESTSVWSILRCALRDGILRRRIDPYADIGHYETLISTDLVQSLPAGYVAHPWLEDTAKVPPGKLWHIRSLSAPTVFCNPLGLTALPDQIHPLLSQPLIELCLRMPTYVLTAGGWDRAIARRAFATDLPREIVNRRGKGGVNQHVREIFETNLPFMRELLLDGLLVQHGFLDRARLERCLSGRDSLFTPAFTEVQDHVSTEAWVRSWSESRRLEAA